jgi:hypothetical protein
MFHWFLVFWYYCNAGTIMSMIFNTRGYIHFCLKQYILFK